MLVKYNRLYINFFSIIQILAETTCSICRKSSILTYICFHFFIAVLITQLNNRFINLRTGPIAFSPVHGGPRGPICELLLTLSDLLGSLRSTWSGRKCKKSLHKSEFHGQILLIFCMRLLHSIAKHNTKFQGKIRIKIKEH